MGYTNYWYQYENFTDEEWDQIKSFFRGMNSVFGGGGLIENQTIENQTYNQEDNIVFNGSIAPHETFVLNKFKQDIAYYDGDDTAFHFCKTNRKPYDKFVWAVLCFARSVKEDKSKFKISNDDGDSLGHEQEEGVPLSEEMMNQSPFENSNLTLNREKI